MFRSVQACDRHLLLKWRNDDETRLNSLNSEPVTLDEHKKWFLSHMNELWLYIDNGESIGVFRVSRSNEVSWTIAPEKRGMGMGGRMVMDGCRLLATKDCIARIKRGNSPSKAIARKAGFIYKQTEDDIEIWERFVQ